MNVAVITMTRDRIAYTQHCFRTLRDNAGVPFDWYVVDNGSRDGTREWLFEQDDLNVVALDSNIGICRGINLVLDDMLDVGDYDAIVRFDNDCEVMVPDTLRVVAETAVEHAWILAPRVRGLLNPPASGPALSLGPHTVAATQILGGVFMAIPARLFDDHGFRFDATQPAWTGDERICQWWRANGGHCGYLEGYDVNHYRTTAGQQAELPEYFARKMAEMT